MNIQTSIFAGVIIHLAAGQCQCWGLIQMYIYSYYRMNHPDVSIRDLYPGLSIMLLFFGILIPTSTFIVKQTGYRPIIFTGCFVYSIGTQLSVQCESMEQFMICQSISCGIGCGLIYYPPILCAWSQTEGKKGVVSGIILASFGISSLLFNQLIVLFANPDLIEPDVDKNGVKQFNDEIASKVPTMIQRISLILFILTFIGAALCSYNYKILKKKQSGNHKIESNLIILKKDIEEPSVLKMEQIKHYSFQIPFTLCLCTYLQSIFLVGVYQNIGFELNQSINSLNMTSLIGPILNSIGRFSLCQLVDLKGQVQTQSLLMGIQILSSMLIHLDNEIIQCSLSALSFFTQGGHFVFTQIFQTQIQDTKLSGLVSSLFGMSFFFGNFLNIFIRYIQDFIGFYNMMQTHLIINVACQITLNQSKLDLKSVKTDLNL